MSDQAPQPRDRDQGAEECEPGCPACNKGPKPGEPWNIGMDPGGSGAGSTVDWEQRAKNAEVAHSLQAQDAAQLRAALEAAQQQLADAVSERDEAIRRMSRFSQEDEEAMDIIHRAANLLRDRGDVDVADLAQARARIQVLERAIRKYLFEDGYDTDPEFERHDTGCATYDAIQHGPCDCGSEALLAVLTEQTAQARDRIQAVRTLHQPIESGENAGFCEECDSGWPCPTTNALDAAQAAQQTEKSE